MNVVKEIESNFDEAQLSSESRFKKSTYTTVGNKNMAKSLRNMLASRESVHQKSISKEEIQKQAHHMMGLLKTGLQKMV